MWAKIKKLFGFESEAPQADSTPVGACFDVPDMRLHASLEKYAALAATLRSTQYRYQEWAENARRVNARMMQGA